MKHFWPLSNPSLSQPQKDTGTGCLASSFYLWRYRCMWRARLGSTSSEAVQSPRTGKKMVNQGPGMSLSGYTKLCLVPGEISLVSFPLLISQPAQNIGVGLFTWLLKDFSNQYFCAPHSFKINYKYSLIILIYM